MHEKVDAIKLDKEVINSYDMSRLYEWDKILGTKHVAENNTSFLKG